MNKIRTRSPRVRRRNEQQHPQIQAQNPGAQQLPQRFPLLRWAILAVCVVAPAVGTYWLFDNVIWAKVPSKLVGRWGVVGGDQDGATLEFFRNGTLVAQVNVEGRHGIIRSQVRVDGNKLFVTSVNPQTGQSETRKQMIKTLTTTDLVLEDQDGKRFKLVRLD